LRYDKYGISTFFQTDVYFCLNAMKEPCKQNSAAGWEVATFESLDEIEAIRPIWREMQRSEFHIVPNSDIDRFAAVVEAGGDQVRPCVMLIKQNGKPAAIVVGRTEYVGVNIKIGYMTLLKPRLKCLTIVYGGFLGRSDEDTASVAVAEILKRLKRRDADMAYINHLKVDSPGSAGKRRPWKKRQAAR